MRQKWVKRMMALFLAGMMVFSLTACSSSSSSSTSEEEATTETEEESGSTDVLCTIFDTDEFYAVVTGVETSTEDYIGIETTFIVLTVEVENKLEDTDLELLIDMVYINGVRFYDFNYNELAAGESAELELKFNYSSYVLEDIGDPTDIEISADLYTLEDGSLSDELDSVSTHIYPEGEANASSYERTSLDSDVNILVDEFVFTYIGNSTDGYYASVYDCTLPFYVGNATTDYIFIEFTITAVNGTDVTESFLYEALTLDGDTCGYIEFDMDFDYELEAVEISDVSEIESVDIEIELTSYGSELPSGTATATLELQ